MKDSPVATVMLPPEPRVKQSLDVVLYLSPGIIPIVTFPFPSSTTVAPVKVIPETSVTVVVPSLTDNIVEDIPLTFIETPFESVSVKILSP